MMVTMNFQQSIAVESTRRCVRVLF